MTMGPGRVRLAAPAVALSLVVSLMPLHPTSVVADGVSYARSDRAFAGVTLRTRGFTEDACVQQRWLPCISSAGDFEPDATARAYVIKELARTQHPLGPPYPATNAIGGASDSLQWEVGPAPDDATSTGDAVPPNWRLDVVTDQTAAGGQLQAYEVERYGSLDVRLAAQRQLAANLGMAQVQSGLAFVRGHDLMDRGWSLAYVDSSASVWCAWAGNMAGADADPADTGLVYFAPQSDPTIPQSVRPQTAGCGDAAERSAAARCARLTGTSCTAPATGPALLAMGAIWAQQQAQGAPEEDGVLTAQRPVLGRPYAQVPDFQGDASYTISVLQDPSASRTLVLDYGDGVFDRATVPAGTGTWSTSFTHTFTPGFGLAVQRAVVMETGAESEFLTAQDTDLVPPAVLGLADPAACVSFGQTIGAGSDHSAAVTSDGSVWTWGNGGQGQLGRDPGLDIGDPTPAAVPGIHGIRAVMAGADDVMAIRADGSVWSWGRNASGQLGNGASFRRFGGPTLVGLLGVGAVAGNPIFHDSGTGRSFAIRSGDGSVWGWGSNGEGELGDGTTAGRVSPAQVPGLGGIVAISSGPYQTFAVNGGGALWSWGLTGTPDQTTQSSAPSLLASGGVAGAAAGGYGTAVRQEHFVARLSDGTLQTWGADDRGELGQGAAAPVFSATPGRVPGVGGVVSAGTTASSAAALDNLGEVFTWGANPTGELGTGDTLSAVRPAPALVPNLGAVELAVGQRHVMAVRSDGTVAGWGGSADGAVGSGTAVQALTSPTDALISGVAQPGGCGAAAAARVAAPAAGGPAHNGPPAVVRGLAGGSLLAGWRARSRALVLRTPVVRPAQHVHMTVRTGRHETDDVLVSR
jgi:alpha-tubulin suppressor-like RCC1 family protein